MEILTFKKENQTLKKTGIALFISCMALFAMIIVMVRGDFEFGSKMSLLAMTILTGCVIFGLLICYGHLSSHPDECFRIKPGYEPGLILLSQGLHDSNLAIDKAESEISISHRKAAGIYDVYYFGINEIRSDLVLEEESGKIIKEVDWDTKALGLLYAGGLGYALASTLGRKKTRIIPAMVKKIIFRVSKTNEPENTFEFKIFNGYSGLEKKRLRQNENYIKGTSKNCQFFLTCGL